MLPRKWMLWKETFATLKAKDGVYSVLGNHDYGDYVSWESAAKKQENLQALIEPFKKTWAGMYC